MLHGAGDLPRQAYADESFQEDPDHGYYVLAAAVFESGGLEEIRGTMRGLRGCRATKKLHWNEMDRAQREDAAKKVAGIEGSMSSSSALRYLESARSELGPPA